MPEPKPTPSADVLHALFRYDAETGHLYFRDRPIEAFNGSSKARGRFQASFAGKQVTAKSRTGYYKVRFRRDDGSYQYLLAHRVIWKMAYGFDALPLIDHIDRNRLNNRLANLRQASLSENSLNRPGWDERLSAGEVGVYARPGNRYRAQISRDGKSTHLGTFGTKDEARFVYAAASAGR